MKKITKKIATALVIHNPLHSNRWWFHRFHWYHNHYNFNLLTAIWWSWRIFLISRGWSLVLNYLMVFSQILLLHWFTKAVWTIQNFCTFHPELLLTLILCLLLFQWNSFRTLESPNLTSFKTGCRSFYIDLYTLLLYKYCSSFYTLLYDFCHHFQPFILLYLCTYVHFAILFMEFKLAAYNYIIVNFI